MTEAQHTPGPWPLSETGDGKRYVIGEGLVSGPKGYEVAEVYSDDCDPAEAIANARLIAAAPDLLAALERLVPADFHEHPDDFMDDWHQAVAAIVRAKGRRP